MADPPAQHPAAPPATVADVMQPPVTAVEQNDHAAAAAYLMKRAGATAQIAVDPPIGVTDAPVRQVTTLALVPGAVLWLFTDGLVARRDEPIDDGIARLCQTVTPGPPEGVCVSVMQALIGSQYPGDDIALLVLRWLRGQAPASTMPAQE